MSFMEFLRMAQAETPPFHIRRGQHLVNMLSRHRPDLAAHMTADKPFDCFYDDKRIPSFWAWVQENWQ